MLPPNSVPVPPAANNVFGLLTRTTRTRRTSLLKDRLTCWVLCALVHRRHVHGLGRPKKARGLRRMGRKICYRSMRSRKQIRVTGDEDAVTWRRIGVPTMYIRNSDGIPNNEKCPQRHRIISVVTCIETSTARTNHRSICSPLQFTA